MGFPFHAIFPFSLVAFNILSLSLIFVSLITMCLSVFFLRFIMPGALCASWTWLTISFSMLGKISAITSSYIYSGPLWVFFFFWDSYNANVGALNVLPVVSQSVFIFFHFFFFCILFYSRYSHHFVFQVIYLFCCSYSALVSFQCIIHLCLFVLQFLQVFGKHFFHLLHCFPEFWIIFTL